MEPRTLQRHARRWCPLGLPCGTTPRAPVGRMRTRAGRAGRARRAERRWYGDGGSIAWGTLQAGRLIEQPLFGWRFRLVAARSAPVGTRVVSGFTTNEAWPGTSGTRLPLHQPVRTSGRSSVTRSSCVGGPTTRGGFGASQQWRARTTDHERSPRSSSRAVTAAMPYPSSQIFMAFLAALFRGGAGCRCRWTAKASSSSGMTLAMSISSDKHLSQASTCASTARTRRRRRGRPSPNEAPPRTAEVGGWSGR